MANTAAGVWVERLIDWGVRVVFGLPGDGINGTMEALRTRRERIQFIQVRREESAAFMACGYGKYTGKLGVCLATTGQTYHDLIGTHYQPAISKGTRRERHGARDLEGLADVRSGQRAGGASYGHAGSAASFPAAAQS